MVEKTRLWRVFFVIGTGLSICFAAPIAQAQVQVGKCKGGMPSYSTIQAAVNAAAAGTAVIVCAGIYPEQVTINKSLNLQGVPSGTADAAVIVSPPGGMVQNATDPSPASSNPPVAGQLFVQGPATVNLTNLTVDGNNNQLSGCSAPTLVGIYYLNASGSLKGLNVRNEVLGPADIACDNGLGIYIEANTGTSVTISTSRVTNYQKNGITANGFGHGSPGPLINFTSNAVVGQGPRASAVENGIQIGYGAKGKVTLNMVIDDIYQAGTSGSPGAAAAGILVNASNGVNVSNNKISSTQFAVAVVSDATYGNADNNNVNLNITSATMLDAVDVCSNNNLVQWNDIYGSTEAGVKVDNSCVEAPGGGSSGNSNTITNNNINGGCAGILEGTGTGNVLSPNILIVNVLTSLMPGSSCAPPVLGTRHPAPFR